MLATSDGRMTDGCAISSIFLRLNLEPFYCCGAKDEYAQFAMMGFFSLLFIFWRATGTEMDRER